MHSRMSKRSACSTHLRLLGLGGHRSKPGRVGPDTIPSPWKLPESLSLHVPESFTGFPSRDMGGVFLKTKDMWPKEAWDR